MRKGMPFRSIAFLALAASLAGCSGDDISSGPPGMEPDRVVRPIATGITLSEVALMQVLKVPLAKDGRPAERGLAPLIAGRDALARLYVKPEHDYPPSITARIQLTVDTPTGQVQAEVSATKTVVHASTESDLESTINVPIPGRLVQATSKASVTLHAADGVVGLGAPGDPASVSASAARYPANGTLAPLDAKPGGEPLRVTLVPVRYDADGSHRLPDVSAEQVERYRQLLYRLFPVSAVEVTVHAPFPWNRRITGDRAGFTPILEAVGELRVAERAEKSVFYHGLFTPTADARDLYVGIPERDTLAGLAIQGNSVSVGVGYADTRERADQSAIAAAHEIGHSHGLFHAPCGDPDAPDPEYPSDARHSAASIGQWGYDQVLGRLVDPGGANPARDFMSYCFPRWISDYHLAKLLERSRANAESSSFRRAMPGVTRRDVSPWGVHVAFRVGLDGELTALPHRESGDVALEYAEPRTVWWRAGDGATVGRSTARFFPYDHAAGGELWVPEAPRGAASGELEGAGVAGVTFRPSESLAAHSPR